LQNDRRSREANAEARGEERGKAEGIALGEERGELKKAREMAKNLLLAGVEVNTIAVASGLSLDEINALKTR
jgi:predicted transposase/invertase (TIGR01784 family)